MERALFVEPCEWKKEQQSIAPILTQALSDIFVMDIYDGSVVPTLANYPLVVVCAGAVANNKEIASELLSYTARGGTVFYLHTGERALTPEIALLCGTAVQHVLPRAYLTLSPSVHPLMRDIPQYEVQVAPNVLQMDCFTNSTVLLSFTYGHIDYPALLLRLFGLGRVFQVAFDGKGMLAHPVSQRIINRIGRLTANRE